MIRAKSNSQHTLEQFAKKKFSNDIRQMVKKGAVIQCDIHWIFKHDNFFTVKQSRTKSPFDKKKMTTITIKFGDIFNTMLPTDYVEQSVSFKEINSDQSSLFAADEHVKQSTNCFPFYRSINKKQSWIRVGDFLNTTEIFKCIGICNKSFYKLGAIFLICCHHKYNCAKYSATANKEEEEVKDPTSGIVPILNNVAVDLSRVMKNELENRSF